MPKIEINPKSRIFAANQLFNGLEKACEDQEEVVVDREDLLRVIQFARLGFSLKQREFDKIWSFLVPREEFDRVSQEDMGNFVELFGETLHHLVGCCKAISKQLDLEEMLMKERSERLEKKNQ